MKRQSLFCLCLSLAAVAITAQPAAAEESFWNRLNPFRLFQSNDAAVSQEDRLNNVRERLAEQGLDEAAIEERIAQITAARESGEKPTTEQIAERLAERGLTQAEIDDRIAQITTARESGTSPFSGGGAPSLDDIRAKLEERGVDSATIDARIAEFTAARESGQLPSRSNAEGAPTTDDLRARLEERGLSAEEIDDRISRMEAARASREAATADGTAPEMSADFEERMARFREMRAERFGR